MSQKSGVDDEMTLEIDVLQLWVDKEQRTMDTLELPACRRMAATMGYESALEHGSILPPLWHWLYFHEADESVELGNDGHPRLGGFLPPVALSRRMWAGGRLRFFEPLLVGSAVEKHSRVKSVTRKSGKSGELCFVTVLHSFTHQGQLMMEEEHDIVYREAAEQNVMTSERKELLRESIRASARLCERTSCTTLQVTPSVTVLFRYSALTFNSHRIHYDRDYCQNVEHYDGLVFHGPLTATLLAGFARECCGQALKCFEFRALQPILDTDTFTVVIDKEGNNATLEAVKSDGIVAMHAQVEC